MRYSVLLALPLVVLSACRSEPAKDVTASGTPEAAAAPAGGPPPMGDPGKNPDMTGVAEEVDTDRDGKLSTAEWKAKGLPESSFNMFEKGRGFVTLEDYRKNAAPPGIDLNGDGKLTVQEFKDFDKQMAAKMAADGKSSPPKP